MPTRYEELSRRRCVARFVVESLHRHPHFSPWRVRGHCAAESSPYFSATTAVGPVGRTPGANQAAVYVGHCNYGESEGTKATSVLRDETEQFVLATKRGKTSWSRSSGTSLFLSWEAFFLMPALFARSIARRFVRATRGGSFSLFVDVAHPRLYSAAKPMAPVCQEASRRRHPFVKGITPGPFLTVEEY